MISLDRSQTAVLSMDCQYDICHEDGAFSGPIPAQLAARGTLAAIRACLDAVRASRVPVIHIRHLADTYREVGDVRIFRGMQRVGALTPGSEGADILCVVAPEPEELVIDKRRISAFAGTDLDQHLRQHGIRTLVLTGVTTNFIVEGTARDAVDRGYRTVVVSDACASTSDDAHRASLKTVLSMLTNVLSQTRSWPRSGTRQPTEGSGTNGRRRR